MVIVTFKPSKEVIIHESIYYSLPDLVKLCSIGVGPGELAGALRWADGVVFRVDMMPPTDEVVREQLEGRIHWGSVEWALLPKYQDVIPIREIKARIPLIDVSANVIQSEVAKELKRQLPKQP